MLCGTKDQMKTEDRNIGTTAVVAVLLAAPLTLIAAVTIALMIKRIMG